MTLQPAIRNLIRSLAPAVFALVVSSGACAQAGPGPAPMVPPPGMPGPGVMGPGMMGPGMMGPGMMGPRRGFPMQALKLSDDQRVQIERIREETRRANWSLLGQLMSERFAMRDLLRADKLSPDAVVDQRKRIDELSRQLLKSRLEARNRIVALLTPEQQKVFRSMPIRGLRG